jgi:hypothetical protein
MKDKTTSNGRTIRVGVNHGPDRRALIYGYSKCQCSEDGD